MQEITIITSNKVGVLAEICELLGGSGVNIEGISGQGMADKGLIRVVTGDTATATKLLTKNGFPHTVGDVFIIEMPDRPGELAKIARKVAKAGVNVESIYILSKNKGAMTQVAVKTDNNAVAMKFMK